MSYYDADPWANHTLNEIKCAECEDYFDQQEEEGGNICEPCLAKGYGEEMTTICGDHLVPVKDCGCLR